VGGERSFHLLQLLQGKRKALKLPRKKESSSSLFDERGEKGEPLTERGKEGATPLHQCWGKEGGESLAIERKRGKKERGANAPSPDLVEGGKEWL